MAIKNRIRAISAEAADIPVNPNNAAIRDTTKKNSANLNIAVSPLVIGRLAIERNNLQSTELRSHGLESLKPDEAGRRVP